MNTLSLRRFLWQLTLLLTVIAGLSQESHAQSPTSDTNAVLKVRIDRDHRQAIAVLRQALDNSHITLSDRLRISSQLIIALRKALKYEEALSLTSEAQKASADIPVQKVHFARLRISILNEMERNQLALEEYSDIAPLLATLTGITGGLRGEIEAANSWLAGGSVMLSVGRLPEAMDLLTRALRIFDAHSGHARGQAECLRQIAHVHYKTGNMGAALREIERAITIAENADPPEGLARLYMRKAHFMSSLGNAEAQYKALFQARTLALADNNLFNLAVIATNLSDVSLKRQDYRGALRFVAEAMPLVKDSGDRESLLVCLINKGIAMNRLGQKEGLDFLRVAIKEFQVTPGKKNVAAEVQGALAEELAFNGDFGKAYEAAMDFKRRSDAVRSEGDQKRIADSTARYQADQKQRQIEALKQEQHAQKRLQLLWALAEALGLLTTIILLISRVYLKRAYSKVAEMSLSDPLTGLRNRRYLASRIDEDLAQLDRQHRNHAHSGEGAPGNGDLVFVMIDMDHFKVVNDEHGHAAGDAVLRQFSAILMEEVRESDTVVRWGGEEFLIVAKQTSCNDIHLLAERVRARVAAHGFDIGNGTILFKTCSIGFASYPFSQSEAVPPRWEDVIELADQCLYAAKASGRNIWVGIVPKGGDSVMPRQLNVPLGLQDGVIGFQHTEGTTIVWPDFDLIVSQSVDGSLGRTAIAAA